MKNEIGILCRTKLFYILFFVKKLDTFEILGFKQEYQDYYIFLLYPHFLET